MIIYIDMDDVLCDFSGAHRKALVDNPKLPFPQSQYGFFVNLPEIEDAVASVKALINSPKYDPYILTAPSIRNPLSYTEKRVWIEQKFGLKFVKKLIICPNKSLLKGQFLIDDNHTGKGQDKFEGKLIHFGSNEFPNWEKVRVFFDI
jgi:5'-nucleotidase